MNQPYSRTRRVSEQMQRELADLLQRELKDPRLGFVTLSGVEVSRDFAHAKVYVSVLGGDSDVAQSLTALRHAAGFLRRELARRVRLRVSPQLQFLHDATTEQGQRLSQLIDQAVAADDAHHTPDAN